MAKTVKDLYHRMPGSGKPQTRRQRAGDEKAYAWAMKAEHGRSYQDQKAHELGRLQHIKRKERGVVVKLRPSQQ